jgi:hypothetical protein
MEYLSSGAINAKGSSKALIAWSPDALGHARTDGWHESRSPGALKKSVLSSACPAVTKIDLTLHLI